MTTLDSDEIRLRLLAGAGPREFDLVEGAAARALRLAAETGAPAVPALDASIAAEDDRRARQRALRVATAQARTVAGALVVLPVVGLLGIGGLIGEPLWRFYLTPTGAIVGSCGLGLIVMGIVVVVALERRATRQPAARRPRPVAAVLVGLPLAIIVSPLAGAVGALVAGVVAVRGSGPGYVRGSDEAADLLATAVSGGLGASAAMRHVADVLDDQYRTVAEGLRRAALAYDLQTDVEMPTGLDRVVLALLSAARLGAPATAVLRRLAADVRADEVTRALEASERLPAQLAFPTALFFLPASVLIVGAPLAAAGLRAAGAAW